MTEKRSPEEVEAVAAFLAGERGKTLWETPSVEQALWRENARRFLKRIDSDLARLNAALCGLSGTQETEPASCPTCGSSVHLVDGKEGTSYYLPIEGQGECDGSGRVTIELQSGGQSYGTETIDCPGCCRCQPPPKGLRYSERELWAATRDPKVRVVLERLARTRQPQDQETPKLQELRLWVEAAEEGTSNSREAKAFRRVVERIRSLRSFEPQDRRWRSISERLSKGEES